MKRGRLSYHSCVSPPHSRRLGLDLWDVCAAALIVREAGGKAWDAEGRPLCLKGFKGHVTAANSAALGRQVLGLIRGADGGQQATSHTSKPAVEHARWAVLLGTGFVAGLLFAKWVRRC